MKYFLTSILLLILNSVSFGQNKQHTFNIIGDIKNWNSKVIYFSSGGIGNDRIWDSTIVKNNHFKFSGILNEPSNGFITTSRDNRVNNLMDKNITKRLFLSPENMNISLTIDSFQEADLLGSKYQLDYKKLEKLKFKYNKEIENLSKLSESLIDSFEKKLKVENQELEKKLLEIKLDSIRTIIDSFQENCSRIDKSFFTNNPKSYVTAYFLQYYYSSLSLKEMKTYYNRMFPKSQK